MWKKIAVFLSFFVFFTPAVMAEVKIEEKFLVGGRTSPFTDLASLVNHLYKAMLVFGGVLVFFLVLIGGFTYIIGAGQERSDEVEKGKKAITWSVVGFLLLFSSYWLIKILGIITGIDFLNSGY
ncbi:MAG: hypothetical protein GXP43_01005 [bacterium]|nr:hypothetical protein [bacterium]